MSFHMLGNLLFFLPFCVASRFVYEDNLKTISDGRNQYLMTSWPGMSPDPDPVPTGG